MKYTINFKDLSEDTQDEIVLKMQKFHWDNGLSLTGEYKNFFEFSRDERVRDILREELCLKEVEFNVDTINY